MMHLLSALPFSSDWLTTSNVQIILGVLIVLIGLAVGFRDLLRFSLMRTWAISSVTFAESIRKRVLWVTLLAMLGVVAVSQFTRPNDPQDAIRQTVKFSLMATGLVVSLVALILASTNLQREIENRVIFTIVTKPTTRLEIIFGKIVGMARVMGLILLIMGVFTWGYTSLRAWNLEKGIKASLAANEVPAASKPTFQHYADVGLLAARSLAPSNDVQIFSKIPTGNTRTLLGDSEQGMIIPFFLDKADFVAPGQESVMDGSVGVIQLKIDYKTVDAAAATRGTDLLQEMGITPSGPTTQASPTAPGPAMGFTPAHVQIQILNQNQGMIFASNDLGGGAKGFLLPPGYANSPLNVQINPEQMARLEQLPGFFVLVTFATPGTEYTIDLGDKPEETPARMLVIGGVSGDSKEVFPTLPANLGITGHVVRFTGRMSSSGMQLRGAPENEPVAVFNFKDAQPKLLRDGRVPFELHTMVERSGGDASLDSDDITQVTVAALDRKTGTLSEAVTVQPESSRAAYFSLPRELVGNGDFELVVRNHTTGHWLGLRPASLAMVTADEGFVFNLFKSLVVLWLLAILVSTIALFCSTFVSWPIAIVLSIVILLGHWGVQQIGDTGTGLSRQMVTDMGLKAAEAKVVSTTMDALNKLLNVVSAVLPDISKYSGGDKLEEGVAVPLSAWRDAAKVTFGYGLPLAVLAFVFLKKKEVAP